MADSRIIIDAKIDTAQAVKSVATMKEKAAEIAETFKKQGMSSAEAMKKAWQQITDSAITGAAKTKASVTGIKSAFKSLSGTASQLGSLLSTVLGPVALIGLSKQCIELGSSVNEVQNVVDTAFGSMSSKMESFAKTSITQFGMSELSAKKTASTYMAMANGIGLAEDAASDMSIALTGLSGDVASFRNISQEDAASKLKGVFTGETEALKELGVVMTQTNLKQYAQTNGIKKNIAAMNQAELATLRYNFVVDALNQASGDFAKTQDSWANQTRILSTQLEQLGANLGVIITQVLLPAVTLLNKIVSFLVTITNSLASAGKTQAATNSAIASSSKDAAAGEEKLSKGIAAAGKAAKKSMASFDELNVLQNNAARGGGGSGSGSGSGSEGGSSSGLNLAPIDFSGLTSQVDTLNTELTESETLVLAIATGFAGWKVTGSIVGGLVASLTVIAIDNLISDWDNLSKAFSGAWDVIAGFFTGDWDRMISGFNTAWEGFLSSSILNNNLGVLIMKCFGFDYEAVRKELLSYIGEGGSMWTLFSTAVDNFWSSIFGGEKKTVSLKAEKKVGGGKKDVLGVGDALKHEETYFEKELRLRMEALQGFLDFFNGIPTELQTAWETVSSWFETNVTDPITSHFEDLQDATELIWGTIGDLINGEWTSVSETWGPVATWFDDNVIKPVSEFFATLWGAAPGQATDAWEGIKKVFNSVGQFFSDTFGGAWEDILEVFSDGGDIFTDIKDGIADAFKGIVNKLITGINTVVSKPFDGINSALRKVRNSEIPGLGIKPFTGIGTVTVPKIPYLAQGAVLPANKPFMAVVGDQKHGTNVEAPLTTIQEAVANVMQGQTDAILAGFEASVGVQKEILEAVLGIEIGDSTIYDAVWRYNRIATVTGKGFVSL